MIEEIEIINKAIDEYKPVKVFALFSGGGDSICSSLITSHAKKFDGCVYIDTGIKIEQAMTRAEKIAHDFGWPFQIVRTPKSYEKIVLKYGFPGPSAHRYMYILLKERAIDKLMRENKTKRRQNILLITGVRSYESKRRMENVTSPIVKAGSKIWVAPMWNWTDEYKEEFSKTNKLPSNPIKEIMHVSGDCLCGAYNDKGDLEILRIFFPNEAKIVDDLQERVLQIHPWGWDEKPPKWIRQYKDGQLFLDDMFMPLCWSCKRANETP